MRRPCISSVHPEISCTVDSQRLKKIPSPYPSNRSGQNFLPPLGASHRRDYRNLSLCLQTFRFVLEEVAKRNHTMYALLLSLCYDRWQGPRWSVIQNVHARAAISPCRICCIERLCLGCHRLSAHLCPHHVRVADQSCLDPFLINMTTHRPKTMNL